GFSLSSTPRMYSIGSPSNHTTVPSTEWSPRGRSSTSEPGTPRSRVPRVPAVPHGGPMPTYSYRCRDCDVAFDIHQSFEEDSLTDCPQCGGGLRKLFNTVGVVFKGSGFYRTDSRASNEPTGPNGPGSGGSSRASASSSPSNGSGASGRSGASSGAGGSSSSGSSNGGAPSGSGPSSSSS